MLSIGGVTLSMPVLLAPMSGITDRPFRMAVRRYGVGLAASEMIAGRALIQADGPGLKGESRKLGEAHGDEHPLAVQIAGCDPEVMAEAARIAEARGAALVDINFGCPAKKVTGNQQAGSALMRVPATAAAIVAAVVAAVQVPVTVKMRLGWDDNSRNAPLLARLVAAEGAAAVTVHGRTRCQFYGGAAEWGAIAAVKAAVSVPVIANGDIDSPQAALRCLALSGADGVMVGRAAQGRPWLPAMIGRVLTGAPPLSEPTPDERHAVARWHFLAMLHAYGAELGLRMARKHLAAYVNGVPGAAAWRGQLMRAETQSQVECLLYEAFAAAADRKGKIEGSGLSPSGLGESPLRANLQRVSRCGMQALPVPV